MRQLTSNELDKLEFLTSKQLEVALIEPTQTGLSKSIMDATAIVREYLLRRSVHDFDTQIQGPLGKKIIKTNIFSAAEIVLSKTSLYRPLTKKGDPRLWISSIGKYSSAGDIVAMAYLDNTIWVFNLTRFNVKSAYSANGAFTDFIMRNIRQDDAVAVELIEKIRLIAQRGFIPSPYKSDTAIGRLLETELGIDINSSKDPDYKGIELKSARSERKHRKNLFTQVPDWSISKLKSSRQILDHYGYIQNGKMRLYCTVKATSFNPQTLGLEVDADAGLLKEISSKNGDVVTWRLKDLEGRLVGKHKETFWVDAISETRDGIEYFKFIRIEHTKNPVLSQFAVLIDQGKITLDHLIKEKGRSASEKGPSFKLDEKSLSLLFPPSKVYELKTND